MKEKRSKKRKRIEREEKQKEKRKEEKRATDNRPERVPLGAAKPLDGVVGLRKRLPRAHRGLVDAVKAEARERAGREGRVRRRLKVVAQVEADVRRLHHARHKVGQLDAALGDGGGGA